MLPVNELLVQIKSCRMSDIGFRKSIYTKKQVGESAAFQDSQSTRRAYLAETAELAYTSGEITIESGGLSWRPKHKLL